MKRLSKKGNVLDSGCQENLSLDISLVLFTVFLGLLLTPTSARRSLYATNTSSTAETPPLAAANVTSNPACFPLIYKAFQACPTCPDCPLAGADVTAQCCELGRELNDMYCFCDTTLVNSIQFANLTPAYLNATLIGICKITNLRLKSITQERCDHRDESEAPGPAPLSGLVAQADKPSHSLSIVAGVVGGAAFLVVALSVIIFLLWKQRSRSHFNPHSSQSLSHSHSQSQSTSWFPWFRSSGSIPSNLSSISGPMSFRLHHLAAATQNFSEKNILGKGGFGTVYKGTLPGGQVVAIKKLDKKALQAGSELLAEVKILGTVYNRHLVRLLGYCFQGGMELLVFDYMENGSVQDAIFGLQPSLTWAQRRNILVGTARGLMYLHDQCEQRIIHRDIKPANILLDSEWQPRLADFGLAKESLFTNTHVTTAVKGTPGYVAPELWMQLLVTPMTDVFSFGMVILVVISGKSPAFDLRSEPECLSPGLTQAALFLAERSRLLDLVDPRMGSDFSPDEVLRFMIVGLHCLHMEPHMRPTMELAVSMLTGVAEIPPLSFAVVTYKQGPPIASSFGWGSLGTAMSMETGWEGGSTPVMTSMSLDSTDVTGGLSMKA